MKNIFFEKIETSENKKNMQGYINYSIEHLSQQARENKPIVDLITQQYTKPQTPPPSPNGKLKIFLLMKIEWI